MLENKGQLNHHTPVPLYFQLKELILEEIKKGEYQPGEALPTELELARMFGLSRTTVRQASAELVQEGWVYKIKSRGTFVGHPKIAQDFLKKLENFNSCILSQGMTPSTQVLELKVLRAREAPHRVQAVLKREPEDSLIRLVRRRRADSLPVLMETFYMSYEDCRHVLGHDYTVESLLSVLGEKEETRVASVDREIEAVEAKEEDARILSCKKGKPILAVCSIARNAQGKAVEIGFARFPGNFSSFQVTVFAKDAISG